MTPTNEIDPRQASWPNKDQRFLVYVNEKCQYPFNLLRQIFCIQFNIQNMQIKNFVSGHASFIAIPIVMNIMKQMLFMPSSLP